MVSRKQTLIQALVWTLTLIVGLSGFAASPLQNAAQAKDNVEYTLGPDDQIRVWALGVEGIAENPLRIDPTGFVDIPTLGRVKAAGMTLEQLRSELLKRLAVDFREPRASVDIVDFGSQPVSVMGAVGRPGVHQLRGQKTLAEVLSLAGGLSPDAGPRVRISRRIDQGKIPLPGATTDSTGQFSVAEVNLKEFMAAAKPTENITVRPNDVITVPKSDVVYVVGAVRKPGGFTLNERSSISVLQALALAEGLGPTTSAKNSRILRANAGGERKEIQVDLKKVLEGKATDIALQPDDILFVPGSVSKQAAGKALDATLYTLGGLAIWHGF